MFNKEEKKGKWDTVKTKFDAGTLAEDASKEQQQASKWDTVRDKFAEKSIKTEHSEIQMDATSPDTSPKSNAPAHFRRARPPTTLSPPAFRYDRTWRPLAPNTLASSSPGAVTTVIPTEWTTH